MPTYHGDKGEDALNDPPREDVRLVSVPHHNTNKVVEQEVGCSGREDRECLDHPVKGLQDH